MRRKALLSNLCYVNSRRVWGRLWLDAGAVHLLYVGGRSGRRRIPLAEIKGVRWNSDDARQNLILYLTNGTSRRLGVQGAGFVKFQLDEYLRKLPVRTTRLLGGGG